MWEQGWLQNDWGVDQVIFSQATNAEKRGREEEIRQVVESGVRSILHVCAAARDESAE